MSALSTSFLTAAGLMLLAAFGALLIGAAFARVPWARRSKRLPPGDGTEADAFGIESTYGSQGSQREAKLGHKPREGEGASDGDAGSDGGGDGGGD